MGIRGIFRNRGRTFEPHYLKVAQEKSALIPTITLCGCGGVNAKELFDDQRQNDEYTSNYCGKCKKITTQIISLFGSPARIMNSAEPPSAHPSG